MSLSRKKSKQDNRWTKMGKWYKMNRIKIIETVQWVAIAISVIAIAISYLSMQ